MVCAITACCIGLDCVGITPTSISTPAPTPTWLPPNVGYPNTKNSKNDPDCKFARSGVLNIPHSEWSLLIPAYGMVLVLLTYFTYFALALAGTPSFADMRAITGEPSYLSSMH